MPVQSKRIESLAAKSENIIENLEESIAHIEIHVDMEDKDLTIKWVSVKPEFQGKGYAKYLMILGMFYTQKYTPEINVAKLDDDSGNYINDIEDVEERKRLCPRKSNRNHLHPPAGG